MKKKVLAVLLTAMVVSTSIAPAYGAEFTSGPEAEEVFSSDTDDTDPAPALDDGDDADLASDLDDGDDDEVRITNLEIATLPEKLQYDLGDITSLSDIDLSGLKLKVTYAYGKTNECELDGKIEDGEILDSEYNFYSVRLLDENLEEVDFDQFDFEAVSPGKYFIEIKNGKISVTIPIEVKIPDNVATLVKTSEANYEITASAENEKAYVRFCPEISGAYAIRSEEYAALLLFDKNGKEILGSDYRFNLEAGKEYILFYRNCGDKIKISAELVYDITSIEPVGELSSNVTYYTPVDFGTAEDGSKEYYVGERWNGKIKITYSNGESEVISTRNGKTKYGMYVKRYVIYNGDKEYPEAGTYDIHIGISGSEKETVIKNVSVKNTSEMPTINGSGSQTVTVGTSSVYTRIKTGKDRRYVVNVSLPWYDLGQQGIFIDSEANGVVNYEDNPGYVRNGEACVLKPNTVYYLRAYIHSGWIENTTATFTIKPQSASISKCTINLDKTSYSYTGKAITPSVTINEGTKGNTKLVQGTDYTVTYTNNKNPGTATITIKGKGSYTGSVKKTFKIQLQNPTLKAVSKSGSANVKITWGKSTGATGYELYSATGSSWKKVATVKSTSYTHKKLKKGTTYKYKVRAYKTVNGKKVYSAYSTVKSVKR